MGLRNTPAPDMLILLDFFPIATIMSAAQLVCLLLYLFHPGILDPLLSPLLFILVTATISTDVTLCNLLPAHILPLGVNLEHFKQMMNSIKLTGLGKAKYQR